MRAAGAHPARSQRDETLTLGRRPPLAIGENGAADQKPPKSVVKQFCCHLMSSLENCLPAALLSIELFCGMLEILAPFLSLWEYNNEHAERYQQENIICESLIYFLFFSNQQKLQNIVRAVYSHSDFF